MDQTNALSSKATDFQPTTRNPQGNVAGGLQPKSAALQPLSGLNQQALPQTTSLRVLNSQGSTPVPAASSETTPQTNGLGIMWVFLIGVILIIGVLLLLAKAAKPLDKLKENTNDVAAVSTEPARPKRKKSKSKNNRRSRK